LNIAKSRISLCEWTGDGWPDLLIGTCYGNVHLFQGRDPDAAPALPPAACELLVPWPNPFNPHVTIPFTLAASGPARLSIVDVAGREVAVLSDGLLDEGRHEAQWDGRDGEGRALPSGLYVARLSAGEQIAARKLLLLR